LVDVDATAIDIPTCSIVLLLLIFFPTPFRLSQGFSQAGNLLRNLENADALMRARGDIQLFVHVGQFHRDDQTAGAIKTPVSYLRYKIEILVKNQYSAF